MGASELVDVWRCQESGHREGLEALPLSTNLGPRSSHPLETFPSLIGIDPKLHSITYKEVSS